jgi:hypothetical protein
MSLGIVAFQINDFFPSQDVHPEKRGDGFSLIPDFPGAGRIARFITIKHLIFLLVWHLFSSLILSWLFPLGFDHRESVAIVTGIAHARFEANSPLMYRLAFPLIPDDQALGIL